MVEKDWDCNDDLKLLKYHNLKVFFGFLFGFKFKNYLQWEPENSGIGRRLLDSSYDFK